MAAAGREAGQRSAGHQSGKEEMTALRTAATSPVRAVTVVAGPGGSVLGVDFRLEAVRLSPQPLSELVQRYAGDQDRGGVR